MAHQPRTLASVAFDRQLSTYAVLDGAGVPQLRRKLDEENAEYMSLYRGDIDPQLLDASPFLVKLEPATPLADWALEGMWERNWGIAALSKSTLPAMYSHFRKFLIVEDPEGNQLYFRFYDPRVLRLYLPTCEPPELDAFFGPMERLVMRDDEPAAGLVFTPHSGQHSFLASALG